MAKISLRMYNREIEGLIEQSQRLDEAIAHCRHILKTYPKHLETYRMLGKAYLEAKRYDQAVDIFQRVLLAAPDDFVSHVGMSIIADDKGKLDEAIWHMERAFEVQPSNAAIQGELQRLFGRRDGVEPPKIRLTRGALAHMYVQGELFPQAISETRAVLANDPKRTDMQTLLARAYFRNGQKAEAAEICAALLGKYPYCLDANRLMAEIAPGTQKADTAAEYRNRVIELDPYAAFIQDSLFRVDTVSDNLVTLDRLEYTGEAAEMPGALGLGLEGESMPASRMPVRGPQAPSTPGAPKPADLPAWLQGSADEAAAQTPAAPPAAGQEELPDFLRQAGWGVAASTSTPETPAPFVEQPAAPADSGGAVEGELPAWVKALAPTEESATPAPPTPPVDESNLFGAKGPEAGAAFAADTPDWLRDLGGEAPSVPAAAEPPLAQSEAPTLPVDVPDWMRELGPVPPSEGPAAAEAATPDWLKDLGERELDEPAASTKSADLTDWLGDLRSEQAAAAPAAAPIEPAEEESPDWLKEFSNDLETPISKAPAPEPPAAAPTPAAPTPEAPEAGTLGTLGTTAQEQDDAMAWLESLAAKHGAKPEELVTDPNARTDVAPEWVDKAKEIGEGTGQVTPAEDETGMWLRSLAAEAETTEPPQATVEPEAAVEPEVPVAPEPAAQPEPEPEPEAIPEVKPFDFRSVFEDQTGFAESEPAAEEEEAPIAEDFEKPAWLRDFAKKPAERPGMEDAPDWLRGVSRETVDEETFGAQESAEANVPTEPLPRPPEAEMAAPAEPTDAAELSTDLPAWLAGLDNEQPEMTAPPGPSGVSDELPAWLQAEAEPEPEVQEPANPADWHPMGLRAAEEEAPASESMRMPEEAQPAAMDIKTQPIEPPPAPAAKPEPLPAEKAPTPRPAPAPARPKPAAASPKLAALSLGDAQTQLGRGNIAAALDIYGKLIRKGKSLEDIIRDLRDALYRYPVEVPLWQSLGDAYMRANRLQEALDAYTKAEELLR